jgi:hypothetical protein
VTNPIQKIDHFDEVVALKWRRPLYESHYLKGNSPDGSRAFWIKHTLLCMGSDPSQRILELWVMLFERGCVPIVAKTEIPWPDLELGPGLSLSCSHARFDNRIAWGSLADIRWDIGFNDGLGALRHLPWSWLYSRFSPTAKAVTPATNIRFTGVVQMSGRTWDLDNWVGLRGHNWSSSHAYRYGWLATNLWEDGGDRSLEGFLAQPRAWSPSIRRVVLRTDTKDHRRLGLQRWTLGGLNENRLDFSFPWMSIQAEAPLEEFVHLVYRQPSGGRALCRCTKFANVKLRVGTHTLHSRTGELEFLDSTTALHDKCHPHPDWTIADGIYRSGV